MPKSCAICSHPNAILINGDLAAGHSIPEVSMKHFGNHHMLDALRRHRRSHLPGVERRARGRNPKNPDKPVARTTWLDHRAQRRPRHRKTAFDSGLRLDNLVIATEPVRIKGVVYPKGTEIPESAWNPDYLNVALRLGTVRRKAS
jgi:hypothetical protein